MTYADLFEAYYTQYRLESDTPASTDDEYIVGMRLANEAVSRWENYDGTLWKELFTTLQDSAQVSPALVTTVTTNDSTYTAPTDMRKAGGNVRILGTDGNTVRTYKVIDQQEVQFKGDQTQFAYFTGDPTNGFVLHLNPAPDAGISGLEIDYDYYKKATRFTTGTDETEMSQPYFIVHRMLANRFRGSRNPYYSSAKSDAEDVLKTMQLENNSGMWTNPWVLPDRSGSSWGA